MTIVRISQWRYNVMFRHEIIAAFSREDLAQAYVARHKVKGKSFC